MTIKITLPLTQQFITNITAEKEPKSYSEVNQEPRWVEVMQTELKGLESNETWKPAISPNGKRAIESKWVYKVKFKPSGEVDRFRARLVAKGYTQHQGIDYHESFSPVAKNSMSINVRVIYFF